MMRNSLLTAFAFFAAVSFCAAQKQTISQAEYFIGADPGEGKGIPLHIPVGDATVEPSSWDTSGLPALAYGGLYYVRVKSSGFIDNNGNNVPGVWSFPTAIKFPTTAVIKAAQAKIVRPGLGYPLFETITNVDTPAHPVVEKFRVSIPTDSLKQGDTLEVRLQGFDDLWGDWTLIPIDTSQFTGVKNGAAPAQELLISNYPNPFSKATMISYSIPNKGNVVVKIYNSLGAEVAMLARGVQSAGAHSVSFSGANLPEGMYFYRLTAGNREQTGTMTLVK